LSRKDMWPPFKALFISILLVLPITNGNIIKEDAKLAEAINVLLEFVQQIDHDQGEIRIKRDAERVSNMDIRDAIFALVNVIQKSSKKVDTHDDKATEMAEKILQAVTSQGGTGSFEKKIDNISTFLLRMYSKMDQIDRSIRQSGRRGGGGSNAALTTLAKESFDILTLLPNYIESTKTAVSELKQDTQTNFAKVESLLGSEDGNNNSLANVLRDTESNIIGASNELKEIVIESGHQAETLFERVNDGYAELTEEIKGLSNVEKVLLDTADSVMDTKKKLEFGVQQIIFKVGELVQVSGGQMDEQLKQQFTEITSIILSNQTEALANLTKKVEREIGQVWRQMGIMYGQVSNSISILEKVKSQTEGYVNNTGKNLGKMEGTVEGLTDRMVDVDDNLNYMLGQLSLVVQEFNTVKSGLNDAMDGLGDEIIEEFRPQQDEGNNSDE